MSDINNLHIDFRPVDLQRSTISSPEVTSLQKIEAGFCAAAQRGEKILGVFDINKTLGTFEKHSFSFYPGVLAELTDLLKTSPVILISGDQASLIQNKVIPALGLYIEDNCSADDKAEVYKNLTIYAQTGMRKITFLPDGGHQSEVIHSAELPKRDFQVIKNCIIPQIQEEFQDDPRFRFLAKQGFGCPNRINESDRHKPLFMQVPPNGSMESIELSVFGIKEGSERQALESLFQVNPEFIQLRDQIIDRSNELLKTYGLKKIHAELGGTSTVDFRRLNKGGVIYMHIGEDVEWDSFVTLIGVGDSFAPKGNDRPFIESCGMTYDVSTDQKNAENALSIIQLINQYSRQGKEKRA